MKTLHSLIASLRQFYSMYFYTYHALYLTSDRPIIVYSMTKSGSSSIHESINDYVTALKVHTLDPVRASQQIADRKAENRWNSGMAVLDRRGRQLYERVVKCGRPARYITLVRNPIERDISRFFQKFDHLAPLDDDGQLTVSMSDMIAFAQEKIENDKQVGSDWFADEYENILGINIYDFAFPKNQGIQRLRFDKADILLMKLETPDATKTKAISKFLDLPSFTLKRTNVAANKDFADVYRQIKQEISLSPTFIDRACNSRLMRHFYTDDEIENTRKKWLRL
ncbi:MAG: putative capsular polysaccharide synthesis family protein [Chloroflexota bacterium]